MRLPDLAPEHWKSYIKLLRARLRYPRCRIGTELVGRGVKLGEGCTLSRHVELGDGVEIGDFSYINCGTIIASGRLGKFCSVGSYCQIGMADHPLDYPSTSPRLYGAKNVFDDGADAGRWRDFPDPPVIGNDVWIGGQAFVRQAVRIGDGAVVAAGAVVIGDVAPYAIVAGVPARQIRLRFAPERIEEMLALGWWGLPREQLANRREWFRTPMERVS